MTASNPGQEKLQELFELIRAAKRSEELADVGKIVDFLEENPRLDTTKKLPVEVAGETVELDAYKYANAIWMGEHIPPTLRERCGYEIVRGVAPKVIQVQDTRTPEERSRRAPPPLGR